MTACSTSIACVQIIDTIIATIIATIVDTIIATIVDTIIATIVDNIIATIVESGSWSPSTSQHKPNSQSAVTKRRL